MVLKKNNFGIMEGSFADLIGDTDIAVNETNVVELSKYVSGILSCSVNWHLSYGNIKVLDNSLVKLFHLGHTCLDFLIQHKDKLEDENKKLITYRQETDRLRKECFSRKLEIKKLKKQLHTFNRLLNKSGSLIIAKCSICCKSFIDENYLQAHILRRHPNEILSKSQSESNTHLTEKLQIEVNLLKEKVNNMYGIVPRNYIPSHYEEIQHSKIENPSFFTTMQRSTEDNNGSFTLKSVNNTDVEYLKSQEKYWRGKLNETERNHAKEIAKLKSKLQKYGEIIYDTGNEVTDIDVQTDRMETVNYVATRTKMVDHLISDGEYIGRNTILSPVVNCNQSINDSYKNIADRIKNTISDNSIDSDNLALQNFSYDTIKTNTVSDNYINSDNVVLPNISDDIDHVTSDASYMNIDTDKNIYTFNKACDSDLGKRVVHLNELIQNDVDSEKLIQNFVDQEEMIQNDVDSKEPIQNDEILSNLNCIVTEKLHYHPQPVCNSDEIIENEGSNVEDAKKSEIMTVENSIYDQTAKVLPTSNIVEKIPSLPESLSSESLRNNILEQLNERLTNIGIDPNIKGISSTMFRNKMEEIKHRQNVTARVIKGYFYWRKICLKLLDNRMEQKIGIDHVSTSSNGLKRILVASSDSNQIIKYKNEDQICSQQNSKEISNQRYADGIINNTSDASTLNFTLSDSSVSMLSQNKKSTISEKKLTGVVKRSTSVGNLPKRVTFADKLITIFNGNFEKCVSSSEPLLISTTDLSPPRSRQNRFFPSIDIMQDVSSELKEIEENMR